jgi:hypothetical protein
MCFPTLDGVLAGVDADHRGVAVITHINIGDFNRRLGQRARENEKLLSVTGVDAKMKLRYELVAICGVVPADRSRSLPRPAALRPAPCSISAVWAGLNFPGSFDRRGVYFRIAMSTTNHTYRSDNLPRVRRGTRQGPGKYLSTKGLCPGQSHGIRRTFSATREGHTWQKIKRSVFMESRCSLTACAAFGLS